jgi:hypothetical protein
MGVKNILELEKENKQIILHKEGFFIKVYERSVYLFTKHIKEYKLTKKIYKNAKQEITLDPERFVELLEKEELTNNKDNELNSILDYLRFNDRKSYNA